MPSATWLRRLAVAAMIFVGALAFSPTAAHASQVGAGNNFGLGLVLGYPDVGLSINYYFSSSVSLQIDPTIHISSGNDNDNISIGGRVDLLFWMPKLTSFGVGDLVWYFGPGVNFGLGLGDNGGFGLGAELPVGIGLRFNPVPIDLNIEVVPRLHIIEDIHFRIGGALNARYYF